MRAWISLLCLLCGLAGGCRAEESLPPCRTVTAIRVVYESGDYRFAREYRSDEKLQELLWYLRRLEPWGTLREEPAAEGGDYYLILAYSDGTSCLYRQRGEEYLCREGGQWQTINPERGAELSFLLATLPGD
ncbi:MAG: hypothetical protein LUH51_02725 [Firmicutes bacterium]|nr:hypothetical protein [Bacillota bacterium]